ncbi:uncharacterized protein LOC132298586 isoform X2 [Cornus florida]|uniref:uncharacterized protein LOC132298586 isoform X2 n=1 Tax=Cornus florida TaxID=4283 RepID=UPI00289B4BA2|nr:uncharacterized protein LOC132298586 isoform X2 [Cornus florida]
MELSTNLQILTERAWALHDKISDIIHQDSISFCTLCSQHGRNCEIEETPQEERDRLITIRDSLKDVENMLVFLQKLKSWQMKDQYAALAHLEETRLILMERVTQYRGRAHSVIEELNAYFGDGRTAFNWNLQMQREKKNDLLGNDRISTSLFSCIRSLINPWNWHSMARTAIKLIVIASISSTIKFNQTRQENGEERRKIISIVDSTMGGKQDFLFTAPNSALDVSYGRG